MMIIWMVLPRIDPREATGNQCIKGKAFDHCAAPSYLNFCAEAFCTKQVHFIMVSSLRLSSSVNPGRYQIIYFAFYFGIATTIACHLIKQSDALNLMNDVYQV